MSAGRHRRSRDPFWAVEAGRYVVRGGRYLYLTVLRWTFRLWPLWIR